MALNLQFQEQIAETVFDERATPLEKWKTFDDEHEDDLSGGFECNICLDLVHDPVVTFCGHLYCWPCIYKWIQFQSIPSENPDQQQPQCPVCKAEISDKTLIPLYGRGSQATKPSEDEVPSKSMVIPQRPPSPRCGGNTLIPTTNSHPSQQLHHQSNQQQSQSYQSYPASLDGTTRNLLHPMIGEMVYAPVFGSASPVYTYPNSYHQAGSSSLRMRRQLLQADRSLGRVYFFLLCCVVACLLLF